MQLFLIRHAQSENNARPVSQRVHDPSLTPLGRAQAQRLAERVAHLHLTRIITSPFLRTLETARFLQQTTSIAPEVRVDLHEKGGCVAGQIVGEMAGRPGMSRTDMAAQFPGYHIAPEIDGQGWWGSRPMETLEQARQRAERLFQATCAEFAASERVAFVMHGDFLLLFLSCFHPQQVNLAWNASLSRISIRDGQATLLEYSCVKHLPNYLVTW